ncbi:sensor histidine kinase [Planotetraspora kaengkrachanensis]|uniref:sensor histidine kinase n=1 Tax=Planotetraspora kaengkrachanensis TaxID=575193 RepID=UPI0019450BC3|nr:ATP-binding protein [Planotetraspora kaengkrachanensis]
MKRAAQVVAAVVLVLTAVGTVLVLRATGAGWALAQNTSQAVVHTVAGVALIRSRGGDRIGLVLLSMGAAAGLQVLLWGYAAGHWPGWEAADWVTRWIWAFSVVPLFTVLPALFPDGRPVTPRWWPVVWAGVAATILVAVFDTTDLVGLLVVVVALLSLASLVVRWIRSGQVARRQIRLLLYAAGYAVLVEAVVDLLPHHVLQTAFLLIPIAPTVAIALAILRYRLYGIDLVIRRTFVYLAVTGLAFSAYLVAVAVLGTALSQVVSPQVALLAAGVVAALVESGRRLFQRRMSALLYGYRDRPLDALAKLRTELAGASTVSEIARRSASVTATALRSPGVTITLLTDGVPEEIARAGEPGPDPISTPLVAQDERLGALVVGPRAGREPYDDKDRRLIAELGHHIAAALAAARLSAELDRAREMTIHSTAEERRRLRQDLHDGLGPLLSGAGLGLDGVRREFEPGSREGRDLRIISDQVRLAAREVRRIIDAVRPGPVADLGLVTAVREHVQRCAALDIGCTLTVSGIVDPPPAVAEAAYLVVLEAVTNALRHADARTCAVRMEQAGGSLTIEVRDDGLGIGPGYVAGVGISSMRRRVASIGGEFAITTDHGTTVTAVFPLEAR